MKNVTEVPTGNQLIQVPVCVSSIMLNQERFQKEPEDDFWGKKILKHGQLFKTPMRYELKPIQKATVAITGSNVLEVKISGVGGFHFADVLGYGTTETEHNCMFYCLQITHCYAVNYVKNNNWCVFLATAETNFYVVPLWSGENEGLRMQQLIFEEGVKGYEEISKPLYEISVEAYPVEKCSSYHRKAPHNLTNTWIKRRIFCATAPQTLYNKSVKFWWFSALWAGIIELRTWGRHMGRNIEHGDATPNMGHAGNKRPFFASFWGTTEHHL
uniref:Apple domain-containing protein n=1 Tax=Romanomermis culicivorax TaxID=13658 RepID=A0A915HDH3_ROMCU